MPEGFNDIPDWNFWENAGAGAAVADLDGDGVPDLVVLTVDAPEGVNAGFYRVGRGLVDGAVTGGWGPWQQVPDWFSETTADAGVAVADVDGDGQPDLVVFLVDAPPGPNAGWYRVGHRLAADGTVTGGWDPWVPVPGWDVWENQGADLAVADVDGDGVLDLVLLMVDAPEGPNGGYYRVGRRLAADGTVDDWGPWIAIPEWNLWENQGAGLAVTDLDGDGRPELVVFCVDNPVGNNGAFYTVGWGLDGSGRAIDGWGPWTRLPDWPFWENAGASVTVLPGADGGRPRLAVVLVDAPEGPNAGYLHVTDLETDLDTAAEQGVWRLLDFGTEVNPVHAALLHTGDVLFFAGSGNDDERFTRSDFRTRVWRHPSAVLDAPDTPVDLFCCGQAFLADGRLLAAGGTEQYDPFHGIRDALVFDPATSAWTAVQPMASGRWYPSLLTLPDGRVLAISGLGDDGLLDLVPEIWSPDTGDWTAVASPGPWPMYAHLVLLADGRVFFTGGQYGDDNGVRPTLWDLSSGATTPVPGLTAPELRNQSATVLLPPAQAQRVLVVGGGAWDVHGHAPAVADAAVADVDQPAPAFRPVAPMHAARMHLCATLLPDRTVLVNGGAAMEEDAAMAALDAEVFDPVTETWTVAARSRVPRLYHSVALLVPDGRVVTAGSNPARRVEDLRIEVFWPPYLFRGPRPALTLATTAAPHGATVTATVEGGRELGSMCLMRPGATTHSTDNEQRLVDVAFTAQPGGELSVVLPGSPALAPPGWYMVFAVDVDGIPSRAAWLRLG